MADDPIEPRLVGLADFVAGVRDELRKAVDARDPELPLVVGPIELDVNLVTRRAVDGSAKVGIYVAELGGSGSWSREETQHVKLTLRPIAPDGGDLPISDQSASRAR